MQRYSRYVALGDSTSEGLDDPDGRGGYRGWANRLAERIAAAQDGGLLYANLAVRGRTSLQVREEQLGPALSLRPDLATVVAGTNDVLRPRFSARAAAAEIEAMQRGLVDQGATVLTFTLPDLAPVMPLARLLGSRLRDFNQELVEACARSGALVCTLADEPVVSDPRLWSKDRLHAGPAGHARIASAAAYVLGLPGADQAWKEPLPEIPPVGLRRRVASEIAWTAGYLLPWLLRHLRGRSSGDGQRAKRPRLEPVELSGS